MSVFSGSERVFLAPHPAILLPGTEAADADLLEELNITLIRQFADTPPRRLGMVLGKMGPVLHLRAKGLDPRPVRPEEKRPAVFEEEALPEDTNDSEALLACSAFLAERCAFRLRLAGRAARTLRLVVGYCDNVHAEGAGRISPASNMDGALDGALREVFFRTVRRRVRVSYLKVTLTDLVRPRVQMSLFPKPDRTRKEEALSNAMDAVRVRFGVGAIRKAGQCIQPAASPI